MKKLLTVTTLMLTLFSSFNTTAFAETKAESADVYVTIADSNGALVLSQEEITVTDVDNDGALTINDALYAAHKAKYEGGAAAGYSSEFTQYGLSLTKLWGDSSGSFGYYVNNQSAWSLEDTIKTGDYINAFVYTDLTTWSDTYCYFDVNTASTDSGKEIALTLSAVGYDADWNKISVPVSGATITVNGAATEIKTDADGKAAVKLENGGTYVISAVSDTQLLVPPVCKVTITEAATTPTPSEKDTSLDNENTSKENETTAAEADADDSTVTTPKTGDSFNVYLFGIIMAASLCTILVISGKKNKTYEK